MQGIITNGLRRVPENRKTRINEDHLYPAVYKKTRTGTITKDVIASTIQNMSMKGHMRVLMSVAWIKSPPNHNPCKDGFRN